MYFDTAKSVLSEAYERDVSVETVLSERYPYSRGGVGHAHRRMKAETTKRIREWLEPGEQPEPDVAYGW